MKTRFRRQALQLYRALKKRHQTWSRKSDAIDRWTGQFWNLDMDYSHPKRIQKVLDWYCSEGCGALYVPIICTGEAFRDRFHDLASARENLRGTTLRYFDDVIQYRFRKTRGSRIQQEHGRVTQRIEQQIQLVDDLVHKRRTLPKVKAKAKALPKKQRQQLSTLLVMDRDLYLQLVMEVPVVQQAFVDYMEDHDLFAKLAAWGKRRGL